jgi:general secretion pathway protein G
MTTRHGRRRTGEAGGFTLIELVVVVSLLVVLASMGLAQYRSSVTRAKEAVLKEDLFRMRDALDQYYADKQHYAPALDALVTEGYLRVIPVDPFTGTSDAWVVIQAEPDPGNPTLEPGVENVKSGSGGTALDGSQYADW